MPYTKDCFIEIINYNLIHGIKEDRLVAQRKAEMMNLLILSHRLKPRCIQGLYKRLNHEYVVFYVLDGVCISKDQFMERLTKAVEGTTIELGE